MSFASYQAEKRRMFGAFLQDINKINRMEPI
jgi:hypothetical protein